jgi:hypothetical protein
MDIRVKGLLLYQGDRARGLYVGGQKKDCSVCCWESGLWGQDCHEVQGENLPLRQQSRVSNTEASKQKQQCSLILASMKQL